MCYSVAGPEAHGSASMATLAATTTTLRTRRKGLSSSRSLLLLAELVLVLLAASCAAATGQDVVSGSSRVVLGLDDGDKTDKGDVRLDRANLELGKHLSFARMGPLPPGLAPGARVTAARVVVTATGPSKEALGVQLELYGALETSNEALLDPVLTPGTTARVAWSDIPAWEKDLPYTSPDVASVVQELLDSPAWSNASAIALLFAPGADADPGGRKVHSYESDPALVVVLEVDFVLAPPPAESPGGGDGAGGGDGGAVAQPGGGDDDEDDDGSAAASGAIAAGVGAACVFVGMGMGVALRARSGSSRTADAGKDKDKDGSDGAGDVEDAEQELASATQAWADKADLVNARKKPERHLSGMGEVIALLKANSNLLASGGKWFQRTRESFWQRESVQPAKSAMAPKLQQQQQQQQPRASDLL